DRRAAVRRAAGNEPRRWKRSMTPVAIPSAPFSATSSRVWQTLPRIAAASDELPRREVCSWRISWNSWRRASAKMGRRLRVAAPSAGTRRKSSKKLNSSSWA
ncbi:unnamed protein product, partial [Symbiodinium sp. KB8]